MDFFPVDNERSWCKLMQGIQKSWSQCSMMLNFWEIRSFLKKMAGWDLWQKTKKPSFQKSPNFAKSKRCRALGPTFLDSLHQFTSRTLIIDWKKSIFDFFTQKGHFYHFCHNNLGRFYGFLLLHSKTRLLSVFWFFHDVLKI